MGALNSDTTINAIKDNASRIIAMRVTHVRIRFFAAFLCFARLFLVELSFFAIVIRSMLFLLEVECNVELVQL